MTMVFVDMVNILEYYAASSTYRGLHGERLVQYVWMMLTLSMNKDSRKEQNSSNSQDSLHRLQTCGTKHLH